MKLERRPLLICLVGVNGAGKSTFYREKLKHLSLPFLNAETVFSHPSKLELLESARAAGFETLLIYIHLVNDELAKYRVEERVARGGHPVPEEKIGPRYHRLIQQVRAAIRKVDKAIFFDNSSRESPFSHIATIRSGSIAKSVDPLPEWAAAMLS